MEYSRCNPPVLPRPPAQKILPAQPFSRTSRSRKGSFFFTKIPLSGAPQHFFNGFPARFDIFSMKKHGEMTFFQKLQRLIRILNTEKLKQALYS